jgi:hypothetical protein
MKKKKQNRGNEKEKERRKFRAQVKSVKFTKRRK